MLSSVVSSATDMNCRMTLLFVEALVLLIAVMKLVALLIPPASSGARSVMFWVLPSGTSLQRALPVGDYRRVCLRAVVWLGAVLVSYGIYWKLVGRFHIGGVWLSYVGSLILLFWGEALSAVLTVLFLPDGRVFPPVHQSPLVARSVADFWGSRWNLWFSDWFRSVIFLPMRGQPVVALILVFAVSGLMHEWVLNLPLYCLTGRAPFGSMVGYFLLQAAGVLVERHFFKRWPGLRRVFAWVVVFVPAPLLINEGLLRALRLWPE